MLSKIGAMVLALAGVGLPLIRAFPLPPLPETLMSMMQEEATPLQNMLSSRAFMTALQRRISHEILDTTHILGAVTLFQQNHHFDPLFFGCCTLSSIYLLSPRTYMTTSKLSKWSDYVTIERHVNRFILVFMIIMNKNIEIAS